jgi:GH15 family glucan-1,4-alpha-glucosidase
MSRVMRVDGYAPIQDYALLGDGRTVALVARDGSIDWLPLPRIDSPTIFARLLDAQHGGAFELAPDAPHDVERRYADDSNVLETTFRTAHGVVRVTDVIPLDHGAQLPWFELIRHVECMEGAVRMRWRVTPRFKAGEGDEDARLEHHDGAVLMKGRDGIVALHLFDAGTADVRDGRIAGAFDVQAGSSSALVIRSTHEEPLPFPRRDWIERRIAETLEDWPRWLDEAGVDGRWRDATRRSALVLRLLTYVPTGAIVAAPTTSLPEKIGGDRNYDYRYSWVRDTAFTLDALLNLRLLVPVHASFAWLLRAVGSTLPDVHVFYEIHGKTVSEQKELSLAGYRGSQPVRRGNAAARQLQLGCWGDLLETAELYVRDGNALDDVTAERLVACVDRLVRIWDREDSGIWELPDKQHYTASKVSAWSAIDRALKLAENGELPDDRVDVWRETANAVKEFVERECWSDNRRAYAMYAGSDMLDASVLRLSRMNYLDTRGERFNSTIDRIRTELSGGGPLLYRYSGQRTEEGAFVACSFWLVEALARAGRVDEATETMDEMVALANDVGLFAEEIDPRTSDFLGNFPQGLSHLALVNAAAAIAEESVSDERRGAASADDAPRG